MTLNELLAELEAFGEVNGRSSIRVAGAAVRIARHRDNDFAVGMEK